AGEIYVVGLGGTVHRIASLSSTATTTMLMTSGSPAMDGASVTFTATVAGTNPTGSDTFTEGGTSIAGCAAVALSGVGNTPGAADGLMIVASVAYFSYVSIDPSISGGRLMLQ